VIFGPASGLPIWIQFLRPITMGCIEFSAKLFDRSSSEYVGSNVSLLHSASV
jgi:hypothetical protein